MRKRNTEEHMSVVKFMAGKVTPSRIPVRAHTQPQPPTQEVLAVCAGTQKLVQPHDAEAGSVPAITHH